MSSTEYLRVDEHMLSILRTRASVFEEQQDSAKRQSDASTSFNDTTTPANLEADLKHYKDLFSKLRFSYIEQVTKEKFVRAIATSPPILVETTQNAALEQQLTAEKAALQAQKASISKQLDHLASIINELVRQYQAAVMTQNVLSDLPVEIEALQSQFDELRKGEVATAEETASERGPHLRLPLKQTIELVDSRESENQLLGEELRVLERTLKDKEQEAKKLETALVPLHEQKWNAVAEAKEARHKRDTGDLSEQENAGRWHNASNNSLSMWLEAV